MTDKRPESFDLILRAPHLVTAEVEMGALIIDAAHARFVDLNPIAAYFWSLLDQPRSLPSLVSAACEQFDIDEGTCRQEIEDWLQNMIGQGLLVTALA